MGGFDGDSSRGLSSAAMSDDRGALGIEDVTAGCDGSGSGSGSGSDSFIGFESFHLFILP
jgi:hypothetical protein